MLYFPKGEEAKIVTGDHFCMKVIIAYALGYRRAADVVSLLLDSIEMKAGSSSTEHSTFLLLECLTDAMNIEELKIMALHAVQSFYDALKRFVDD